MLAGRVPRGRCPSFTRASLLAGAPSARQPSRTPTTSHPPPTHHSPTRLLSSRLLPVRCVPPRHRLAAATATGALFSPSDRSTATPARGSHLVVRAAAPRKESSPNNQLRGTKVGGRPPPRVLNVATAVEAPSSDADAPSSDADACVINMVSEDLPLTEEEKLLFKLLLETKEHFGLNTTMRAAGGWVRDKLIGRNSDDIDIALDDMLGKDFAEKVNEYLALKGEEVHSVGVIQTNPEQSKHLETARLRVRGVWIDLVNLRSEAYAADSRIPTMEFGTPEQDAKRRDLTINSMFYNINTGTVEDFTGQGLADLRAGIIRTPLPPRETFLDDPLRVLRATRFSARFCFGLDPALVEAAATDEVRNALHDKVSKERVGTEVDSMLKTQAPVEAMRHLLRMNIFNTVFEVPKECNLPEGRLYADTCVTAMHAVHTTLQHLPPDFLSPEERRVCLLAALLLPLQGIEVKAKKKMVPVAEHIMREELKMSSKTSENVIALQKASVDVINIASDLQMANIQPRDGGLNVEPSDEKGGGGYPAHLCEKAGLMVRGLKDMWKAALPLTALHDMQCLATLVESECAVDFESTGEIDATTQAAARAELTLQLMGVVDAMGLATAWEMKPLLDGKTVMQELGMKQGGPALGKLMDAQLRWQLRHPHATKEECAAWLHTLTPPA